MNRGIKFPREQGRPISVRRARAEQKRWKNNPKHKGMTDSYPVDASMIAKTLRETPEATGIEFCNGLDGSEYAPVMAAVTGEGMPLVAFNSTDYISLDEFAACRAAWKEKYRNSPDTLQFFFLGGDALMQNIEDFDITKYEVTFVEKADDTDTGLLLGYSSGIDKDPGDDDPDTALNFSQSCPPMCGGN